MGGCAVLEQLDLRNNRLKHIPASIAGLTKLTRVWFSQNQLRFLPAEFLLNDERQQHEPVKLATTSANGTCCEHAHMASQSRSGVGASSAQCWPW